MTQPLIEARGVRKEFSAGSSQTVEVLRDVSLALAPAESLAIVGRSGTGKSTLLNLLGSLESPSTGDILFRGAPMAPWSEAQREAYRRDQIGLIFQLHHLLPQCSALENVMLPLLAGGRRPDASDRERAEGLLRQVGLAERSHHRPGMLSGGERQRVAVARALIRKPALLLADEPTGALDENQAQALVDLLLALNQTDGVALIMVTHARPLAQRMARTLELRHGRLEPLT